MAASKLPPPSHETNPPTDRLPRRNVAVTTLLPPAVFAPAPAPEGRHTELSRQLHSTIRAAMQTRAGSRQRAALHAHLAELERNESLPGVAEEALLVTPYSVDDVDVILRLARAVFSAGRGCTLQDSKLIRYLLTRGHVYDAAGDIVDDSRLASHIRELHALGCTGTPSWRPPPPGMTSSGAHACAEAGRIECLRVVSELLDPCVQPGSDLMSMRATTFPMPARTIPSLSDGHDKYNNYSLLHAAAAHGQAAMCAHLLQSGWDASKLLFQRTGDGHSPLALALCSSIECSAVAICDTVAVVLQELSDARAAIRACGLCEPRPPYATIDAPARLGARVDGRNALSSCVRTRMLTFVCSAARMYVATPIVLFASAYLRDATACSEGLKCLQSMHMDVDVCFCSTSHGVRIHDPLRAGGDIALAARLASRIDAALAVCKQMKTAELSKTDVDGVLPRLVQLWAEHVWPVSRAGESDTVSCWAWMRRLHAVRHRRVTLAALVSARCMLNHC